MVSLKILLTQRCATALALVTSPPQNQEFLSLCETSSCQRKPPPETLMDNCDILPCLNAVGWLSATQGSDSIEYSQVDVPMTQSKDNDDSVSREEFEAVQDQVGYLTEKISELSEKLKDLEDRVENLEDDTDDRAN